MEIDTKITEIEETHELIYGKFLHLRLDDSRDLEDYYKLSKEITIILEKYKKYCDEIIPFMTPYEYFLLMYQKICRKLHTIQNAIDVIEAQDKEDVEIYGRPLPRHLENHIDWEKLYDELRK